MPYRGAILVSGAVLILAGASWYVQPAEVRPAATGRQAPLPPASTSRAVPAAAPAPAPRSVSEPLAPAPAAPRDRQPLAPFPPSAVLDATESALRQFLASPPPGEPAGGREHAPGEGRVATGDDVERLREATQHALRDAMSKAAGQPGTGAALREALERAARASEGGGHPR